MSDRTVYHLLRSLQLLTGDPDPQDKPGPVYPDFMSVAHHQRWGDPIKERGQIGIGQPVIERAIGHPGQRRTEQRDDRSLARFIEQRDIFRAALLDQLESPARGGEQVAVRDLLMGMTTVSANDAAVALAEGAMGSVNAWAAAMNARAAALPNPCPRNAGAIS